MDRFERHFGMSKKRLLTYLATLHRDQLQNAGTYTVYSIPPDGHVKMHLQRLLAGEAVFADATGAPILLVKCGNPLTPGPEAITETSPFGPASTPKGITPMLESALPSFTQVGPEAPEILLSNPNVPMGLLPPPESIVESSPPNSSAPLELIGTGANSGNLLPILGGVVWGIGSTGPSHPGQPVPEPSGIVTFGAGLVWAVKRRKTTC